MFEEAVDAIDDTMEGDPPQLNTMPLGANAMRERARVQITP
jgi:hypothetical protein